jgi:DNA polymerase-3 subunit epsilon
MKIERPIIVFDLETTSVDTETARIVQIAAIKINHDGSTEEKNLLINPTIPIPLETSEIHGITDEMVKNAPTFKQVAQSMKNWFKGCDVAGFNSDSYDIPVISAEMERCGITFLDWEFNLVDVMKMYRHFYPNKLTDIYKRFTGKELEDAHDALGDVKATMVVMKHILENHFDSIPTPEEVDVLLQGEKFRVDIGGKMYKDAEGVVRWNFSKNVGQPVLADPGFYNWFLKQSFPKDSKDKLLNLIQNNKERHA